MLLRRLGALVLACLVAAVPADAKPKGVIAAIIHVESGGNPNVTGRHGEIGLMQIKLATARGVGYRGTRQGLYHPATNVRWGTAYFEEGLRLAGGHLDTAISRYQRGIYSRFTGCSSYCRKVKAAMR